MKHIQKSLDSGKLRPDSEVVTCFHPPSRDHLCHLAVVSMKTDRTHHELVLKAVFWDWESDIEYIC